MADIVFSEGAIFMTAFFMVSGFLIYSKHDDMELSFISLKVFYLRRLFEFYPAYLVICVKSLLIDHTLEPTQLLLFASAELLVQ
ncbi:hypothetical protein CE91St41_13490 [Oscillospiraceae bacterium]|nr:hypothetical protein CE91St40_24050 [Oscillospiraceae bacterium]BDF74460.1 hypothetical protein CE91St41_13490 [Oscillospiraceae bacterium]